jgi:cobalt-zinc-cadmium efflux system outer membrane protein
VAEGALRHAELGRRNAERELVTDVKTQLVVLAGAQARLVVARQVRDALARTVDLDRLKYPGSIDEGELARIEREKLEADNVVDRSAYAVVDASLALAFLLGDRSDTPPTYAATADVLPFRVPPRLADTTAAALTRRAWGVRADLHQADVEVGRTAAAIDLASRERIPTVGWTLAYTQTGNGTTAIQPPTVTLALNIPIPVLYQQQGEIGRARADRDAATVDRERTAAKIAVEVNSHYAEVLAHRRVVERMERSLLDRARVARDITELQYRAGAATLIDYLDAQRAYAETTGAHVDALVSYWSAIFQLEAAVGEELT